MTMNKKTIMLFIALASYYGGFGQSSFICTSKSTDLYINTPSTFTYFVDGVLCSDIYIKSDNGEVVLLDSMCMFQVVPDKIGPIHILFIKKSNLKTLDSFNYKVKKLPPPDATVARMSGGQIQLNVFKVQDGIIPVLNNFDYDRKYIVNSFTLVAIRNDSSVIVQKCIGARFPSSLKQRFSSLKKGDIILLINIIYKGPGDEEGILKPIEFHLVE